MHASRHFESGDVICEFAARSIEPYPTYLTIQTGEQQHITLSPEFLQFTNHSCDPNVFFDTARMELVCLKNISPGDELAYFYPSTEWEMDQPFDCRCGTDRCLQVIKGARHLESEVRERYQFSEFIAVKMKQQDNL